MLRLAVEFQSTPPRGGRRVLRIDDLIPFKVSIHAPTGGATVHGLTLPTTAGRSTLSANLPAKITVSINPPGKGHRIRQSTMRVSAIFVLPRIPLGNQGRLGFALFAVGQDCPVRHPAFSGDSVTRLSAHRDRASASPPRVRPGASSCCRGSRTAGCLRRDQTH